MKRFRDLLKGTILHSKIELITNEAQSFLRELGKNDFFHSKSIESILDRLVPDSIKENESFFNKGEIYLLLVSIYLHDIGRKTNAFHHEIESYKNIRENPHLYYLNPFEAEAVSQICAAHAKEEEWSIEKNDSNFGIAELSQISGGGASDLQKLGALLRLCDELDNTYIRTKSISSQKLSVRNIIQDVNPKYELAIIEIQASPTNWNEYELLQKTVSDTQQRLKEVEKYLKPIQLYYYQIWLKPKDFQGPMSINFKDTSSQDFVLKVATLLERRYSDVKLDEKLCNINIPILCIEKKIGIVSKTAVYCCIDINLDIAREIRGALAFLMDKKEINTGIVITQKKVSGEIKEIFQSAYIHVEDIDFFIINLYNFKNAFSHYMKKLSNKEINQKSIFINPCGYLENEERVEDVESYINDWIENDKSVQLTILGDYGVGKTTICQRIVFEKVKFLNQTDFIDKDTRIPILIELKNYIAGTQIESLITNYLVNKLNVDIKFKEFEELNKQGKFLIVLDGFDEIGNLPNEDIVLKTFQELDKLVYQNSKIILTCRTHFFKTNVEIHTLHSGSKLYDSINDKLGYSFLFIDNFSPEQIINYLKSWDSENYNHYIDTINTVYNLKDLAERPILLNVIAKTIPQLSTEKGKTINSSDLYKTYVDYWLKRDDWRTEVKINQRKELAERIAEYLFENDLIEIHYSQLNEFCKSLNLKEHSINVLDFELRTCNFMKRDVKGNYQFVHKSFQEYILASILFEQTFSKSKLTVKWLLPFEQGYSKRSKKTSSKETQTFFLQLVENKIHFDLPEKFTENCIDDNEKENILIKVILEFKNKSYGLFFTKYLLNENRVIHESDIIKYIIDSYDFISCIDFLCEQVPIKGVDYSKKLYRRLILNMATESQLKKFAESIQQYEQKEEEVVEIKENLYPYRKELYKLKLYEIVSETENLDERELKITIFKKDWIRKKAEYDKRLKRMKRLRIN